MSLFITTGCESELESTNNNIMRSDMNNELVSNNIEDYDFEKWTAKSFLLSDYDDLSKVEISEVEVYLNEINALEENYTETSKTKKNIWSLETTF